MHKLQAAAHLLEYVLSSQGEPVPADIRFQAMSITGKNHRRPDGAVVQMLADELYWVKKPVLEEMFTGGQTGTLLREWYDLNVKPSRTAQEIRDAEQSELDKKYQAAMAKLTAEEQEIVTSYHQAFA